MDSCEYINYSKNTKLIELEYFKKFSIYEISLLQSIKDDIYCTLGKFSHSRLESNIKFFQNKVDEAFSKYKLKLVHKKIINDVIKSLALLYDDDDKTNKNFNSTINKVFLKHCKQDIDSLIDWSFEEKFIKKYSHEFDKYGRFIPFPIHPFYIPKAKNS